LSSPARPELAIVVVSYNTLAELTRCLESLHLHPPSATHQIVVVDNASSDGSADAVRRDWPSVLLIETGANLGFARANNVGIRAGRSDLVLLLNSDTIVPPGSIDRLVDDLRRHPEAAAVGPRLVGGGGRPEISYGSMIGPFNELRRKLLMALHERGFGPVSRWVDRATRRECWPDWVSGACLLVRRDDADAVGLFDERFFLYTEDVDFCAALRQRGRLVRYTPEAEVVHLRGRSRAAMPAESERFYRQSQLAFYAKHHPRWEKWLRRYLRLRGRLPDG
jgi:N-acetylglucosaminyl-diphospho-decaprenol L-rhamnosyltransferase